MSNKNIGERVDINSDEIMKAISILDSSLNILEGSMLTSISTDFKVLSSLGLFTDGLDKLKTQIETMKKSNENLMTKISLHAAEMQEVEESIVAEVNATFISSGNYSSGGGGNYYSDISQISVSTVTENTNINNDQVADAINNIKPIDINNILSFLNINKGEYSISDILFCDVGSGILLCLLKKFYGDKDIKIDTIVTKDSFNIQKTLLEKLLNDDVVIDNKEFNSSLIVIEKEYFKSIAKENDIAVSELLLNERYETLLLSSIKKLYLGKDLEQYNLEEDSIENVKLYVEKVADDNGVSVDKVLSDVNFLSDLKGV